MAQPSQMKTPEARALRGEMEPDFLRAQREQSPQNSPRTQREQSPQSFFRAQRENDQSSNLKPLPVPLGTKKTLNLKRQVDLEPTPSAKNLTQ